MIHITLKNGQTLLFDEIENVYITDNVIDSPFVETIKNRAEALLKAMPYRYGDNFIVLRPPDPDVIEDGDDIEITSSPISHVRKL